MDLTGLVPEELLIRLREIQGRIGIPGKEIENELLKSIRASVDVFVDSAERDEVELLEKCEKTRSNISEMQQRMSEMVPDLEPILPPYHPLLQRLTTIYNGVEAALLSRERRRALAIERGERAASELCMEPPVLPPERSPGEMSLDVICAIEARVGELENIRLSRVTARQNITLSIEKLEEQLGIAHSVQKTERGSLSSASLRECEERELRLQQMRTDRIQEIQKVGSQIHTLQNILQCPISPLPSGDDVSENTISRLKSTLSDLHREKIGHIDKFISGARDQIRQLWKQLYFGDAEKAEFVSSFESTTFDEKLLDLHEQEIERLQMLLAEPDRHKILLRVRAYEDLRRFETELEAAQKNPARLLGSATNLLEEERKRNMVAKRKPPVVMDLVKLLRDWQESHLEPFRVSGENLLDNLLASENKLLRTMKYKRSIISRDDNLVKASPPPASVPAPAPVQRRLRTSNLHSPQQVGRTKKNPIPRRMLKSDALAAKSPRITKAEPSAQPLQAAAATAAAASTPTMPSIPYDENIPARILSPRSKYKQWRKSELEQLRNRPVTYGGSERNLS